MFNSQYYTCEQVDQRLLQGYLDDYNEENGTTLTKSQFLSKLNSVLGNWEGVDNEPTLNSNRFVKSNGVFTVKELALINKANMSEISESLPISSTIDNTILLNGVVSNNSFFEVRMYDIQEDSIYLFSGTKGPTVYGDGLFYISWFDQNDNFIGGSLPMLQNDTTIFKDFIILPPNGASKAGITVQKSVSNYYNFNSSTDVILSRDLKNSINRIMDGDYEVQKENERRFTRVSEITELTPIESKEGKFFYSDGERDNNGFRYYKFEVIGGENYLFSSYFGPNTEIPFIYWIDSNGTITSDIYTGNSGPGSLPVIYTDEPVTAPTGAVYACLNESKYNLSKVSMKHKGNIVKSIALKEWLDILTKAVGREAFVEMVYKEQLGVFPYYLSGQMNINAYMNSYIYEDIDPAKEYKAKDFGIPSSGYTGIANVLYYNGYTYLGYEAVTYHEAGPYYQSDYLQLNVPAKCTRIIITTQKDYTEKPSLLEEGVAPISSQELLDAIGERKYLPSCSLGDVRTNGTWLLIDSNTYTDKPDTLLVGWLRVTVIPGESDWILQEYLTWDGKYFKRQFPDDLTVGEWQQMSGGGNIYNVNNTFNNIQQTVNLTATPSITADTNNYLAPSGNDSDRTADILTMLQSNGICRLGAGEYWIDSLVMPDNTSIIGSGTATKVYLKSGDNKFAIKMGKYCVVKDMALYGSTSAISVTETVGTRHGILWSGNYTSQRDGSLQPMYGTVSDVYISRFNGGGITCYDTGYGTRNYISATNVHIENCGAGINISYWSEFHKFTNVRCYGCYYGCINNGGNNMFVNCDFSGCNGIAFFMDNSQGQSPNNSHGSVVGCVFNHTANNTGVGIKILNCNNGFVFSGCQIFFSKIQIEDSAGIEVVSTNFGKNNCDIIVKGGGIILFANNLHEDTPPSISITDNNKVHFVNCYNRANGNLISA